MRAHVLFLLFAATLSAQNFTIGGKLGIPFTGAMGPSNESRPFAGGPSVEFRLPGGFAVEASAIYQRIGRTYWFNYSTQQSNTPGLLINRTRGNSWEFPVIGKYYFRPQRSRWAPYVGAGLAFRTVGFHTDESISAPTSLLPNLHQEYRSELNLGPTAAAGVRFRVGRLAFSPEVRYTRWGSQGILPNKNGVGFFLGFRF